MPVAESRAGLSRLLPDFRLNDDVEVVVIGAHRQPDTALVPYRQYRELTSAFHVVEFDLELVLGVPVSAVAVGSLDARRDRDTLAGAVRL